jgi:phosphoribosylamine--glycine ligase
MRVHSRSRILVVGKDARTDAIAAVLKAAPSGPELFALSELRIPGLVDKCVEIVVVDTLLDPKDLERVCRELLPDLVIIGPEEPLEAGYVDRLDAMDIPAFGPARDLAAIESSKSWARQLLDKYDIPGNPRYRTFDTDASLRSYMEELGSFVVKPDGLTAGKGVKVFGEHLHTVDEAMAYALEMLGSRHGRVQIEERLEGQALVHCPLVQDHKRAFEGDQGPNTGGMGSYSCADFSLPFLTDADVLQAHMISEKVIEAIGRETGKPYKGVLYGGFIATADGVGLIEYNARFGDPEAMNVLPILDADFAELSFAVAEGTLGEANWSFQHKATVCKYIVPENYPGPSQPAKLDISAAEMNAFGARWFWAACRQEGKEISMTSSRTGAFVGIGNSLNEAEAAAEQAAQEFEQGRPVRHRRDIGTEALVRKRIEHMQELRGPAYRPQPSSG